MFFTVRLQKSSKKNKENYKDFVLIDRIKGLSTYHFFDFEEIRNDENKLKEFIAIFSKEQIINNGFVEILKEESAIEEQNFTKEFYKLFHETRLMLLKEFQENKVSKEESIHCAQLFLNRLMFMFFAEDTGKLEKRLFEDLIIKLLDSNQEFGSTNHTMHTEIVTNVVEKQLFGCLVTKYKELQVEKTNTTKWMNLSAIPVVLIKKKCQIGLSKDQESLRKIQLSTKIITLKN